MTLEDQALTSFYLVIAAFLSMLIGLDRERLDKSAGLRTHMLVGVGSCLFTILSAKAFDAADTSRVAANIVTGIGFLGAGVIYKSGGRVHDLTTAASVWITAAVGMAVGVGAWLLAIAATVTVWLILDTLRRYSKRTDD
jgi:putative Mg2+ transporter-C (MgtC) family protein